jgi:hypothetical protein
MLLYHPAHHEALLALREAELARRHARRSAVQPAPIRNNATPLLRRAANQPEPERQPLPRRTTAPTP